MKKIKINGLELGTIWIDDAEEIKRPYPKRIQLYKTILPIIKGRFCSDEMKTFEIVALIQNNYRRRCKTG